MPSRRECHSQGVGKPSISNCKRVLDCATPEGSMNNGQTRDLCACLLYAESEDEVIGLLTKAGYWEDPTVWRHYGDVENNWGQGGNQQSLAEAALVEKIVNSVDARLLNECLERRIDPQRTRRAQEYPRSGLPFLRGRHWQ